MEWRLRALGVFFFIGFCGLIVRLFYWQVVRAQYLSSQARLQYRSGESVSALRGDIYASDDTWLAASVESWIVFAVPPDLEEGIRDVANKLAPFFVESEDEDYDDRLLDEAMRIEGLFSSSESVWIPIARKVDRDKKRNIEALGIAGIGFEETESRFYPEASSSAHLLGFVGKDESGDDRGYFGLEGYYDLSLSGRSGFVNKELDAKGVPILFGEHREIGALNGVDLVTHIDKGIQMIVEKYLEEGIEQYGAKSGVIIIMDPQSGAVVSLASYPSYDPRTYYEFGDEYFRNPAISNSFEPGSIFKPLVMAAGIDSGAVEYDTKCDICNGPVNVDKYTIETWNSEYYPDSIMVDVIVHSDNVGMVFVGNRLGTDRLYDYLVRFGIGSLTEIDLQGEESPVLRDRSEWSEVDRATATFGQGIATTPMQIMKAFSAIANDGVAMQPQVVDRIRVDGWEEDIEPLEVERVISKEASDEVAQMMVMAASEGEAKWTARRGYGVAGKTGTAQIPIAGHYDEEKTVASFIGFAPHDDPKFMMLVSLREPETSPWASETAAPLWFGIAEELFPYFGVKPEN